MISRGAPLLALVGLLLAFASTTTQAFYIPGVNPHSFQEREVVDLHFNSITSAKTQLPLDAYHLPFCQPIQGITIMNQNFGEFLQGDRIHNSPYKLEMKADKYCEPLHDQLGTNGNAWRAAQ